MSFWIRLESIFGLFCFLSRFSKLFSRRLNQNLTYVQYEVVERGADLESQVPAEKRTCHNKQESINFDSHFLAVEREGKTCERPGSVTPARRQGASGDGKLEASRDAHRQDGAVATKERARDGARPVHETIELFNKPNDIETSLPRYQNKVAPAPEKSWRRDERRMTLPRDKLEKLKEQLQEKFAARLQKCKSERDFSTHRVDYVRTKTLTKIWTEDNRKRSNGDQHAYSELKKASRNVSEREKSESNDRKSEKEMHNCLLKGNLSQTNKSLANADDKLESLKRSLAAKRPAKQLDMFDERKRLKSLPEPNNLKKMPRKDEKAASEYGGGWDCHRCGLRVYHAERMLACGNAYHKTCFSCVGCRKLLGPRTYLEADMEIHCSQCHAKKFGLTGYGYGLGPGVLQTSP